MYTNVGKTLLNLIIVSTPSIYLQEISFPYISLATLSLRDKLDHLYASFTNTILMDLASNYTSFKTTFDVNLPIKSMFKQI